MASASARLRRGLAALGLLVLVGAPTLVSEAPVASATVSTTACPFHLSSLTSNGAAGTLFFEVTLIPNNPAGHCVAQVTTTMAITPTQPGVSAYHNITNNPLTTTANYAFAPGRPNPFVQIGWAMFHCADPAVPGIATLTVNGQRVSTPVQPSTCSGMGPSILRGGVIDRVIGIAPTPDGQGYTTADQFANVTTRGDAGSLPPLSVVPNGLIVGVDATPSGSGAWLAGADGGVFTMGNASFHGSAGNLALAQPIVGMASTPDGQGYWLVAADGGVFAYGDAGFFGSTGGLHLNAPIVGMAPTHDGKGYWLVASDGGIFAFGDAAFQGSLGSLVLNAPVVGMAAHPGGGYWLVAADGGVFSFGGAPFKGSAGNLPLNEPVTGMAATPDGNGYWLVGGDGGIFTYGDATYHGSGATVSSAP